MTERKQEDEFLRDAIELFRREMGFGEDIAANLVKNYSYKEKGDIETLLEYSKSEGDLSAIIMGSAGPEREGLEKMLKADRVKFVSYETQGIKGAGYVILCRPEDKKAVDRSVKEAFIKPRGEERDPAGRDGAWQEPPRGFEKAMEGTDPAKGFEPGRGDEGPGR